MTSLTLLRCVTCRAHRAWVGAMEMAQLQILEMYRPDAFGKVIQAHDLTGQRISDKTAAALPEDLSIRVNPSHRNRAVMPPVSTQRNLGLWTWLVAARRRLLSQRLVRSSVVIILAPALEALLLRFWVSRRRASGIGLKNTMMLVMRGVLFGMSFGRKLHADTQPPPPHRQRRQAQRPGGSPRHSVIATNHSRQTKTPKQPHKYTAYRPGSLIRPSPYAQHITREQIPHRQRMQP